MLKPFYFGIGVVIRAVVSASAVLFAPLVAGVDRHRGGSSRLPFHAPIPQAAAEAVHTWLAQVTPSVLHAALLALVALVLVSTGGMVVALLVRRWMEHRKQAAEQDWCACVMAGRAQVSPRVAEYEALWK